MSTYWAPVRRTAPPPPNRPALLQPRKEPHGSFVNRCRPAFPGSGPWVARGQAAGLCCLPRAVPAETRPRSDLPPPAQSRPSPSPPRPLPLGRDPSPGTCCVGGALAPAPRADLLQALPCCAPLHQDSRSGCPRRPPGKSRGPWGAPWGLGARAPAPGSPARQPHHAVTPPPKPGTCTTSDLGPQAPWLCLRSPEPPVRKSLGSWGSGVAAGVCTSYFPLQTLGRPGPPQTCNTPARPSPPACFWLSRAHTQRVLPAVLLQPQFLLPWDPGNQPLAGCWVSPPQRSRGQLLEGRAGSCSVSSVPSAVVIAGPSTFSLQLEETGRVSRGPRGSRRGGAGRLGPFPALWDPPCLPCPCGPGAQIARPAPFRKQSKGVNCKRLIPMLVLN